MSRPGAEAGPSPLAGMRVVDLLVGPVGGIGRLLAELGAEVLRVEPPGGSPDRRAAPMAGGISLPFLTANIGKRARVLDPSSAADRAAFLALLADADLLIENALPWGGIDAAMLRDRCPALVILSVTPFGLGGACAGWQATDPVLHALSGELSRSGVPGRAPLLPPGMLATECAIAQAAMLGLMATVQRLRSGQGDHLDFSMLDGAALALDPGYGIAGSAAAGVPASKLPRGRPEAGFQYPIIPCADGQVRLCVLSPRQWRSMFEWMGSPAEFADPAYATLQKRFRSTTLIPAIGRLFATRTRAELEEEGERRGVPIGGVLTLREALATAHIRARRAFAAFELGDGRTVPLPRGVLEVDGQRAAPAWRLPALADGEGLAPRHAWPPSLPMSGPRPLSGLRVLDLGVIVVGAEQGRLLADFGADVVKVENEAFPDGARQTRDGSALSVTFAAGHRNKRSLALDLRSAEGRALFLQLVERADVLMSNFKPGTLDALGVSAEVLLARNPALIVVDSSAFGPSGPWSRRLGYGPLVRASAGLTAQWRYPDDAGRYADAMTVYPDHVAARIGVTAVLALLIRRARSGRGGTVSISQAEVMLSQQAVQIAAGGLVDETAEPAARYAPWGVFACAGDDQWCVVTVTDDAQWQALCGLMQRPDLAAEPSLRTAAGRVSRRACVEGAVSRWLAALTPQAAMARLQAAGIPAGAMLRVSELPDFVHYRQRQLFAEVCHPAIPLPFVLESASVRCRRLPVPEQRPAPLLGAHSAEVLEDWLGLDSARIQALQARGVIMGKAAGSTPCPGA